MKEILRERRCRIRFSICFLRYVRNATLMCRLPDTLLFLPLTMLAHIAATNQLNSPKVKAGARRALYHSPIRTSARFFSSWLRKTPEWGVCESRSPFFHSNFFSKSLRAKLPDGQTCRAGSDLTAILPANEEAPEPCGTCPGSGGFLV
jgi:hypothetical protein